jgi:hypothetical protein
MGADFASSSLDRAAAKLAAARKDIETARASVAGSFSGDPFAAESALRHAAGCLGECGTLLRLPGAGDRAALREAALCLAEELARLEVLLGRSESCVAGWRNRLGAMQAGYTPGGSPAQPAAARCIHLEG